MSNLIKIGIHETGEIFDSRKCLAVELGLNENTLGNYIFGKIPWNGLTFYQIKLDKSNRICRDCNCLLTELNSRRCMFDNGDYICISCLNKYGRKQNQKYRNAHPFRIKIHTLRQRNPENHVCLEDIEKVWNNQSGQCVICNDELDKHSFHIDHIIAKSKGGKSEIENFQFLCEKCNRGKFTWTTEEYIEHCKKVTENNRR